MTNILRFIIIGILSLVLSTKAFSACTSSCGAYINYPMPLKVKKSEITFIFLGITNVLPNGTKITIILTNDTQTEVNFFISELNLSPNIIYKVAANSPNYYKTIVPLNKALFLLNKIPGAIVILNNSILISTNNTIQKIEIENE